MPYCAKCGAEVSEDMAFCSRCGASLKGVPPARYRSEKEEKGEKQEKEEKGEKQEKEERGEAEKYEKRQFGFLGSLIGGLFLIFVGFMSYLTVTGYAVSEVWWALFLVLIGVLIIIGAILATRRHPRPRETI